MKCKLFTRVLCLALVAALSLGMLTGCGKKKDSTSTMADLKCYKIATVDTGLTDLCDYPNDTALIVDDRMYTSGCKYLDTDTGSVQLNMLLSCNMDGSDPTAVEVATHPYQQDTGYVSLYGPFAVENGTAILAEDYCASWEEGTEQYFINTIDIATGEMLNSVELKAPNADSYLNLYNAKYADGKLLCTGESDILVFDATGACKTIKVLEGEGYINSLYVMSDGSCLLSYYDAEWNSLLKEVDLTTGTLGKEITLPTEVSNCTLISDEKGQMYAYSGEIGIYRLDLENNTAQLICNWLDSDIDSGSEISTLFAHTDGSFTSIGRGEYWDKLYLSTLTYVDPTTLPEKNVLTLACNYSYSLRSAVLKFNRSSDTTRITLKDYSVYNSDENNYTGATTQMNTDIISGSCPDILMVDSSLPFDAYVAKGLFTDLYPLLDADPDTDRANLLENVLQACETDGKLTSIIPLFSIFTLAGRADYVGENPGWTWEEFHAVLDANPQCQYAIEYINRNNLLTYMVAFGGDNLVNAATGECHFDSDAFIQMLEYAKTYPEEYEYDDEVSDKERFSSGTTLLSTVDISEFTSIKDTAYNMDGQVVYKGFPDDNGGNGAVISPNVQLAIAESCVDKNAAWDFVSYFLTEEYFEGNSYNLPLNKALLNQLVEEAMADDGSGDLVFTEDAAAEEVLTEEEIETEESAAEDPLNDAADVVTEEAETDIAIAEDGMDDYEEYDDYWAKPVTQAQIDQMMAVITGTTTIFRYDSALLDIVEEEAAAFFAGSKTAAETANVIQGRASTYLSEIR